MPFVTTGDGAEIFYKDWGSGRPVMFHHGWPLSSDEWDAQLLFFAQRGYRVIAHDRKFGDIGRSQVRRASVLQALAMLQELAEKEEPQPPAGIS